MEKQANAKINAILNGIRQASAIFFSLIIFPYVSRILGANNYGKYSFCYSCISYCLLIAMLGIHAYGVREGARIRNDKKELEKFAAQLTAINFGATCAAFFVLVNAICVSKKMYMNKELLLIFSIPLVTSFFSREWILVVVEDYFAITIGYIAVQIMNIVCILLFVKEKNDYVIYTIIMACSLMANNFVSLLCSRKYIGFGVSFRSAFSRHLYPIMVLFGGQIATSVYVQAGITMLGFMTTEREVGVYSVVSNIYLAIKGMINAMISVVIPRIVSYSNEKTKEHYDLFVEKLFDGLTMLICPLVIGIIVFADYILLIIGGEDYRMGASSLRMLAIALFFATYSGFLCNALLIPRREEKTVLTISITAVIINLLFNWGLIPKYGIIGAAVASVASEGTVLILAYYKNGANKRKAWNNIFATVLGSGVVLGICIWIKREIENYFWTVGLSFLASVLSYMLILLILRNSIVVDSFRKCIKRTKK